jgi:hypothetical protein
MTREAVPEKQREAAIETKDGKFAVADEGEELGEAGKAALEKERKAKKEQKDRADALERERDELKQAAEAAAKGITREKLDEINAAAEKKFKPIVDENAELKAKLRKVQLTDRLEARFLKAGGKKERWAKAKKDLETRVDLTDDGEDFIVKDENGKVTSETLDDFLSTTYKKEAPFFYQGVNSSGSGAEASEGAGGSGYDPVKAGKAAAEAQKKANEQNALAFK